MSQKEENLPANALIKSGIADPRKIENHLKSELQRRLMDAQHYSDEEIRRITDLDTALFAYDFILSTKESERFRALTRLSHCALNPFQPTSHRKIIGPIIVCCKKAIWRFVQAHFEKAFQGIEEFCAWSVVSQAKQTAEIGRLRKLLDLKSTSTNTE